MSRVPVYVYESIPNYLVSPSMVVFVVVVVVVVVVAAVAVVHVFECHGVG